MLPVSMLWIFINFLSPNTLQWYLGRRVYWTSKRKEVFWDHFCLTFGFWLTFARTTFKQFRTRLIWLQFASNFFWFHLIPLGLCLIRIILLLAVDKRMTSNFLLTEDDFSPQMLYIFRFSNAFREGLWEVRPIVLHAEIFDLFIDGLDVLVDLPLIP